MEARRIIHLKVLRCVPSMFIITLLINFAALSQDKPIDSTVPVFSTQEEAVKHIAARVVPDNSQWRAALTKKTRETNENVAAEKIANKSGQTAVLSAALVANSGFEEGDQAWENWGNSNVVAGNAPSGNYHLAIGTGAGGRGQTVAIAANTTYTLSGWGGVSATGETGWIGVHYLGSDGNTIAPQSLLQFTSTTYEQKQITIRTTPNTTQLRVWAWKNEGENYFYADEIVLTEASNNYDKIRFLEQATFGPNAASFEDLNNQGFQRWIEDQFNKPYPTFPYPNFALKSGDQNVGCPTTDPNSAICRRDHYTLYNQQNWFFKEALYGEAQLRHRMSWALHQMWVTSGNTNNQGRWMEEYFKILNRHAFGNYRDLMYDMTLSPAMGNYLDMARSVATRPNENYPREILQLFTVGLYFLNQDGTLMLDENGNPIPTYDQSKVDNFTEVFTGWSFCNVAASCPNFVSGTTNYIDPMRLTPGSHNTTSKSLLNYPNARNAVIAACTNCTNDTNRSVYAYNSLNAALDNIFYHPTLGAFVSKSLIKQFVTSNPSPDYVARVTAAFNDNGNGVRGDMKAVIRAILLDPEARGNIKTDPNYGKLREPVLFVTNLLRQFDVRSANRSDLSDGVLNGQTSNLGQNVLNPPSVFNYFSPNYVIPRSNLTGPEFGIYNTGTSFARINFVNTMVFSRINVNTGSNIPLGTSISLVELQQIAQSDPTGEELIDAVNNRMLHGTMSENAKNALRTAIRAVPATNSLLRAQQAVYLTASSSQYQVQR